MCPCRCQQEDSYQLVDSRPVQRRGGGPKQFQQNRFQQNQRRQQEEAAAAATAKRQPRKQQEKRQFQHFQRNDQRVSRTPLLLLNGQSATTVRRVFTRLNWRA